LHAAAEIPINPSVIHTSNLRVSNPVASMATVNRAWGITKARRAGEKAAKN
jgi:hypothetical protein